MRVTSWDCSARSVVPWSRRTSAHVDLGYEASSGASLRRRVARFCLAFAGFYWLLLASAGSCWLLLAPTGFGWLRLASKLVLTGFEAGPQLAKLAKLVPASSLWLVSSPCCEGMLNRLSWKYRSAVEALASHLVE